MDWITHFITQFEAFSAGHTAAAYCTILRKWVFGFPSSVTITVPVPELHQFIYHFYNIPSGNGKVEFPFHILDPVVTIILNVVDGVDLATKEGSEDVIRLHPTGRRSCDSVTE